MLKRILTLAICALALASLALASVAAASDGGDPIVVGFSQVGVESDWRIANTKSMRETFSEANGYRLILKDAQQKHENQLAAVRGFVEQGVDYIVIAPVSEEGWEEALSEVAESGIPVIIVDRMINVPEDLYACWVGSDFRREGEVAVAWMEEAFADRDAVRIVHLQGSMGSSAQIGRTEGLEAGVDRNGTRELAYQATGDFTDVKGKEVMEYVLKNIGEFDVVYCENDNMAYGAIAAMESAGLAFGLGGEVAVISFDATRKGLGETLLGRINFNVECNPLHGPRVEALIRQLEAGETPDKLAYVEEEAFDASKITQGDIDARSY